MNEFDDMDEYQRVIHANRLYYSRTARLYDSTETCVVDKAAQGMLSSDLDEILSMLRAQASSPLCLDACAGSGNVSLKPLERGAHVTACDISPDLLKILARKATGLGDSVRIECAEVSDFLRKDRGEYDLIVFSSALHHLPDIESVLSLACGRLAEGGILYTVFDPIPNADLRLAARWILRADYLGWKLRWQCQDIPAAFGRRIRRAWNSTRRRGARASWKGSLELSPENLGVLAEYHVESGVDDRQLVESLRDQGMNIVWHIRYSGARHGPIRSLLRELRQSTSFKLLARKAA